MKKLVLVLIILCGMARADIMPRYVDSIRNYGIGFTRVKSPIIFLKAPEKNSEVLETINFDYNNGLECSTFKQECELEKIFSVYLTNKQVAFLTTMDETTGYSLVCYNEKKALCGWVENKTNIFYNWNTFFNVLGRKYGLYAFKDIDKNDKIIYASPDKASNSLGSIELPKYISPWLVQGNWVLAKVYDFNSKIKTGWLNFRGEDGKLRYFVDFK